MHLINENLQAARKHPCWIGSYLEYTQHIPSPEIFRKWAAISAVAGALERRVWVTTGAGPMFPNMFIVLVAPPGVGKDQAIVPARDLWAATGCLNVAPISLTHKGLIDHLADPVSQKQYLCTNEQGQKTYESYHSILIAAPEFGVLIDKYDLGFISALNELFNCWDLFEERQRTTRNGAVLRIEKPHIHLIAGTQPKFLGELLPEAAYGMGFTARIILVYSSTPIRVPLFSTARRNHALFASLTSDLKAITQLRGTFILSDEVQKQIEHWHMIESEKTRPTHSKLVHYNARRIMHLIKLCMVYSASRSDDMQIESCDFDQAIADLYEAESLMPNIFREMTAGGRGEQIEELVQEALTQFGHGEFPESFAATFLMERVPSYEVKNVIEVMLTARVMIEVKKPLPDGTRYFRLGTLKKVE